MGAIQQAINQMTSSALGAAVGVKAAQMAEQQKKSTEIEKQKAEADKAKNEELIKIEKQKAADLKQAQDIALTKQDISEAKTEMSKVEEKLQGQNLARKENLQEAKKLKGEIADLQSQQENLTTEQRYEGYSESIDKDISKREKQIGHLSYERKKINLSKKQLAEELGAKKEVIQGYEDVLTKLRGGVK